MRHVKSKRNTHAPNRTGPSHGPSHRGGQRRRHRPHGEAPVHHGSQQQQPYTGPQKEVSGIVDILTNGVGFLRQMEHDLQPSRNDCFLSPGLIQQNRLQSGMLLKAFAQSNPSAGKASPVVKIQEINGIPAENYVVPVPFERQISIDPHDRYVLTPAGNQQSERSMRLLELMTPIGKGQRALIVAPPKTGKTTLLHDLASSVAQHHPETLVVVLLIDERPEEVTMFKRSVRGMVIASSSDKEASLHLKTAKLTLEMARSQAESGKDVFLLLDSITRLGRASNREEGNRGKTMSGGVGSRALEFPRRFFGSARKLEGGGSLSIIATALIDTGSRMDEVIFQEFKGTGNMELVLDRNIANHRIFPAVDLNQSGTRKEEKLLPPDWLIASQKLRRHLAALPPQEALGVLLERLEKAESVQAFCTSLA
jgi:transcription termination factor Rho